MGQLIGRALGRSLQRITLVSVHDEAGGPGPHADIFCQCAWFTDTGAAQGWSHGSHSLTVSVLLAFLRSEFNAPK
jgi:hypothetical protein